MSLTSDFIVGFPGETDADFEQTMKLIDDVGFDGSFSFVYSAAPGHAGRAIRRPGRARRRAGTARTAAGGHRKSSTAPAAKRWSATIERVLVTGRAARNAGDLAARTDNNRVVNFPGDDGLIGQHAEVRITAALAHSLRGELAAGS